MCIVQARPALALSAADCLTPRYVRRKHEHRVSVGAPFGLQIHRLEKPRSDYC